MIMQSAMATKWEGITMEKPITQKTKILAHMLLHHAITPLDALKLYGCMRLASRICDLRKEGYIILKKKQQKGSYATYYLEPGQREKINNKVSEEISKIRTFNRLLDTANFHETVQALNQNRE